MLSKELIRDFNKTRNTIDKSLLCHAPFTALNFEQNGNITACCYNRVNVLGTYPEHSIMDTWFGAKADELRQYIKNNDLGGGCSACEELLLGNNFKGTKAVFFDEYAHNPLKRKWKELIGGKVYPKVFEFELSNKCNLECTMCNGYFSSSIRSNREKLPPLTNPYDDAFVKQVEEFIPHLTDMKFLGGEPFLIDIYYKIWESTANIKPSTKLHITTNGTIFNGRVKGLINRLTCGIIMSIDSLNRESYEQIRINADYDKVMNNMQKYLEYTREKNTYLSMAVCPIRINWRDMPEMVEYCMKEDATIHFNTVWTPESLSLRSMSKEELQEVEDYYRSFSFTGKTFRQKMAVSNFRELINQITYWKDEKGKKKQKTYDLIDHFPDMAIQDLEVLKQFPEDRLTQEIAWVSLLHYTAAKKVEAEKVKELQIAAKLGVEFEDKIDLNRRLTDLWKKHDDKTFLDAFFNALVFLSKVFMPANDEASLKAKTADIINTLLGMDNREPLIKDLITDVSKKSIVNQIAVIAENELDVIYGHLQEHY